MIENILQFVSEQVNPHTSTSRNQQVNLPKTSLFLQEEMMANVQKPGSAQRNIPSSKPIRTDFRINYANFFGTDNWQHGDINIGMPSLPETSSLTENDFIVSI